MSRPDEIDSASRLRQLVLTAIDDRKGIDPVALDVAELTDITDVMVIASGSSSRHVKALLDHVLETVKAAGFRVLGIEGRDRNDWVLVDLADVVVHIMRADSRSFYDLERLWEAPSERQLGAGTGAGAAQEVSLSTSSVPASDSSAVSF